MYDFWSAITPLQVAFTTDAYEFIANQESMTVVALGSSKMRGLQWAGFRRKIPTWKCRILQPCNFIRIAVLSDVGNRGVNSCFSGFSCTRVGAKYILPSEYPLMRYQFKE